MPEEESFLRFDKILVLEKEVNKLQKRLKENHIDRLNKKICKIEAGVVFISLVDNLEKIANHLANIAEGIKGKLMWKIETGPNET